MSTSTARATLPAQGKRHPLLFQRRLNEQVFWPCILILALSGGLLLWNPVDLEPVRLSLSVVLAGTGAILVLTFALRLMAYAQCRTAGLFIRVPFFRLLIPYHEIKATRPTELFRMFPSNRLRWTQRRFVEPLLDETVVVVELETLPRPRSWLRLWMSEFVLCPDTVGLVVPVSDWLAFRNELDEFRAWQRRF